MIGPGVGPRWVFMNNDVDRPTFVPSILVTGDLPLTPDEQAMQPPPVPRARCCHSQIRQGRITYYPDCTHELAGQTVNLPEWTE